MNVTVNKKSLLHAIDSVRPAVLLKNTMPILANIRLEARPGRLSLLTTNLETAVRVHIPAVVHEAGTVTLPAAQLAKTVKPQKGDVTLTLLPIKTMVRIQGSESGSASLFGLPADEFPTMGTSEAHGITLNGAEFAAMLNRVSHCASTSESRYSLNGVALDLHAHTLRLAATDGYRMAVLTKTLEEKHCTPDYTLDDPTPLTKGERRKVFILPTLAADLAAKLFARSGDIEIVRGTKDYDTQILYMTDARNAVEVSSRCLDGEYPNYLRMFPSHPTHAELQTGHDAPQTEARVSVAALTDALNSVLPFVNKHTGATTFTFTADSLSLFAGNPDTGQAEETISASYPAAADMPEGTFVIGFNARFLLEHLRTVGTDKVRFLFIDTHAAVEVRPEGADDWQAILMPVRML